MDIYDLRHALRLDSADPQHSYQLHRKVMKQHAEMTRKYKHTVSPDMLERVGTALVAGWQLPTPTEENFEQWARAERQYNRALARVLHMEQHGEEVTPDSLETWFPDHGDWPDRDTHVSRYVQLAGPD